MFRKLTLSLVVAMLVLLRADTAAAIDEAACCLPTTSRLDALMNPIKGGDEKFFSRPGGPPNVLFIVDTSGSMEAWPRKWSSTRGCSDSFLNGLGYDRSETYDRLWTGLSSQSTNWFATARYYTAPDAGYGTTFGGTPAGNSWTSADSACSISDISDSDKSLCKSCLESQGYYIHNATVRRVKGNFLNFYAPRDSGAVKVLADVIRDLKEVRFGVMGFRTRDEKVCWGARPDGANECLCMLQPMGPTCAKSYPLDGSAVENNRNSVLNSLTNVNTNNSNGFGWGKCNTPLADALYAAGYYFQSKTAPTPFSYFLTSHDTSADFNVSDGVCFECGFNAVILLTDGDPNGEGEIVDLPSDLTSQTLDCPGCSDSSLHKVAKFLWEKDLRFDMPGQQRIATYTIGFSEDVADSKLLKETARRGGGRFFPARSTSELKRVILAILDDINTRNTSFSSAAINTLQTQSATLTAVVPRMMPAKDKPWVGRLYRYEQFNEFVEDQDKNGDGDRGDIFLIDSEGDIVAEDNSSEYRKVTSTHGGPGGTAVYGGTATPFWEASAKLEEFGHVSRNIWTVTDNGRGPNGGGKKDGALTEADALVRFDLEHLQELRQYLAVSGAPLCPTLTTTSTGTTTLNRGLILEKMGMGVLEAAGELPPGTLGSVSLLSPPQDTLDLLCTALVIQYVRGQDIFNENGVNGHKDTRPSVLGDIFHSSPVIVDPPVDKFLCDIGISNQCVRTLYAQNTGLPATPMDNGPQTRTSCTDDTMKSRDAYDTYHYLHRKRERLILVGANDGMLHAFSDGVGVEDSSSGTCEISYPSMVAGGDNGREKWAFIPPDLLPRLQEMLQGHAYYVDGDIMVRDVWADGATGRRDGRKAWDEFRTVAVVAEGRGGTHYFALEMLWVTEGDEAGAAQDRPGFRWMFPQPCTDEAQRFGKTLLSLSPKPPPIGPVLIEDSSGVLRHGADRAPTAERWVAMLSGGWSPGAEKGRGLYMVDVWNGQVSGRKDNLLWKWEYEASASGDEQQPRQNMTHGFVAPVAMADYGSNAKPGFDGFFDTAVVGDLGGQLWTLRFFQPGVFDATTGLIKNWSGGRSFVMDRDAGQSIRNRSPFYYLSSLAVQPDNKALRAFVGTGNRYSLIESGIGACRFDNPQACSKLGCGETLVGYKLTRDGSAYMELGNTWGNQSFSSSQYTPWSSSTTGGFCSSPGDEDFLKAEFVSRNVVSCPKPSGGGTLGYEFARTKVECGQNSAGVYDCRVRDPGNTINMSDLDVNSSTTATTLGKNRFFGIWVYGGGEARTFDEAWNPAATTTNQARQFDSRRLSDTSGQLVNVTNVTCDATGACQCIAGKTCDTKLVAGADDAGWFYEYEGLAHKTASGSAVLASCTLWNSMYPGPSAGGACSGSNSNRARFHQGDFVSGAPNCAAGFKTPDGFVRYQDRTVLAPPPEPATAIQVSKTGQVKYSTLILEPGQTQATEVQVSSDMDVLQYIYEIPVSRGLHACRHDTSSQGGMKACIPSEL